MKRVFGLCRRLSMHTRTHTHTNRSLVVHILEAIAHLIYKPYAKQKNMLTDSAYETTISTLLSVSHSLGSRHGGSFTLCTYILRAQICIRKYRNWYQARSCSIQFNRKILNESVSLYFFFLQPGCLLSVRRTLRSFIFDIKSLR